MLGVGLFDRRPMIRHHGQFGDRSALVRAAKRHVVPIGLEPELAIRPVEAVEKMRFAERWLTVEPAIGFQLLQSAALRDAQHLVDQLTWAHVEAAMLRAKTRGERTDHLVIVAAFARRIDQLRAKDEILMAPAAIDVVVLEEGRSR